MSVNYGLDGPVIIYNRTVFIMAGPSRAPTIDPITVGGGEVGGLG